MLGGGGAAAALWLVGGEGLACEGLREVAPSLAEEESLAEDESLADRVHRSLPRSPPRPAGCSRVDGRGASPSGPPPPLPLDVGERLSLAIPPPGCTEPLGRYEGGLDCLLEARWGEDGLLHEGLSERFLSSNSELAGTAEPPFAAEKAGSESIGARRCEAS